MPLPNEHSARMNAPDKYREIRRKNDHFGPGIHALFGVRKSDGKTELESVHFDDAKFTPAQARKWLADHAMKPIEFEAAEGAAASRFHVAHLRELTGREELRTKVGNMGKGIDAVFASFADKEVLQGLCFDPSLYTAEQARAWLAASGYSPISFAAGEDFTPAEQPGVLGVVSGSEGFACAGGPAVENNVPVRRFVKDMIRTGVYVHPKLKWRLDVTPARMDAWKAAFDQMKANGVDVEIPVDHRADAAAVIGYVTDMFREGDTLYGVHEIRGQENIDLVQRCKNTSVLIEKDYVDGKENRYGEAITHNSVVQAPVVPGQDHFIPLAASRRGPDHVPLFFNNKELHMFDATQIAELKKLLGVDDVTPENAFAKITAKLAGMAASLKDLETGKTNHETQIGELRTQLDAARKAAGRGVEIDQEILQDRAESAAEQIDALVERGHIVPACSASLKDILIGKPGALNAFALSNKLTGAEQPLARAVIAALKMNTPVALGEHTKHQGIAMSRVVPGDKAPTVDKDVQGSMIEAAGGKKA